MARRQATLGLVGLTCLGYGAGPGCARGPEVDHRTEGPGPESARHRPAGAAAVAVDAGSQVANGELRDELGRVVHPHALPARRVVSLAPNVTEILFALGADRQLVGIDTFSDHPQPQVERVAKVGSDYTPSLEKIVALAPDLVVTSMTANRQETVDALESLGVPTFVTDTRSLSDMDRLWRDLGLLTGHRREAELAVRRLHADLEAVRARAASAPPRPGVLIVVWNEPLFVVGGHTFVDDLITVAGGRNVASEVSGFVRYPLERVVKVAPDVLVILAHNQTAAAAEASAFWSRWPSIPAVRRHRVHLVEDSLIIRPGARLVEGAETLRGLIHPTPGP